VQSVVGVLLRGADEEAGLEGVVEVDVECLQSWRAVGWWDGGDRGVEDEVVVGECGYIGAVGGDGWVGGCGCGGDGGGGEDGEEVVEAVDPFPAVELEDEVLDFQERGWLLEAFQPSNALRVGRTD